MSEILSNCHVWVFLTYVLEKKLHNPGLNIPKWDPRSRSRVNSGFRKTHLTQVGLVLNIVAGSISPYYHVLYYDIFSTVVGITAVDS